MTKYTPDTRMRTLRVRDMTYPDDGMTAMCPLEYTLDNEMEAMRA